VKPKATRSSKKKGKERKEGRWVKASLAIASA